MFVESNGATSDPLGWPVIWVLDPQFGQTVYEVNGARKVKSDAQVNKNSDTVQTFFLRGGARKDSAPTPFFCKLLKLTETSRAKKLMFWLQVNIDKGNSRKYDVIR